MYTLGVKARVALISVVLLSRLHAQDPARSKASDYPAHVSLATMEIGAEYLTHSIPTEKGFYFAKEYLVVEVAVFAAGTDGVTTSASQFTLRVNGKTVLQTVSPGMVAAALKYPDWEMRPNLTAQAGPVIVGAPPAVGRFPEDGRSGVPRSAPVPQPEDPSGVGKPADLPVEQAVARAALPEGPAEEQAIGCLFFRFEGKTKSIRKLELLYDPGQSGPKATIPLF